MAESTSAEGAGGGYPGFDGKVGRVFTTSDPRPGRSAVAEPMERRTF